MRSVIPRQRATHLFNKGVQPIKNVLRPLSTNFRLNLYWEKSGEEICIYIHIYIAQGCKGKRRWWSLYETMALFPAITRPPPPPPVTLRILLYLPRLSPLLHPLAMFEVAVESRTHRIYFIKPFPVASSCESSALECKIIIFQTHYTE